MKTGDAPEAGTQVSRAEFDKLQEQLALLTKTDSPDTLTLEGKEKKPIDTETLLKDLISGLQKKDNNETYGGAYSYVEEKDIDPDDFLEHGVTFFVYKTGYVIVDDMRNGLPVRVPFGKPIIFQYQSTQRKQIGKYVELHNLATYTSFSNKEVAWLRAHNKFGFIFFDSIKKAMNINVRLAEKLAKTIIAVGSMPYDRVIQASKDRDLAVVANIDEMRSQLAHRIAQDDLQADSDAQKQRAMDSVKDQAVLQD